MHVRVEREAKLSVRVLYEWTVSSSKSIGLFYEMFIRDYYY